MVASFSEVMEDTEAALERRRRWEGDSARLDFDGVGVLDLGVEEDLDELKLASGVSDLLGVLGAFNPSKESFESLLLLRVFLEGVSSKLSKLEVLFVGDSSGDSEGDELLVGVTEDAES